MLGFGFYICLYVSGKYVSMHGLLDLLHSDGGSVQNPEHARRAMQGEPTKYVRRLDRSSRRLVCLVDWHFVILEKAYIHG